MLNPLLAVSSLMLLLVSPSATPEPPTWEEATRALQQHVTIHVPRVTVTSSTTIILRASRPVTLIEKKANDCVKVENISGFAVNTADSVDLVLRDGSLLRAKLGRDCPALGFYSGFYVKANKDQKICAKRDSFRSRSGRSCDVEAFRTLAVAR